ncbi:uncharacterized protein METZ01_LOCUS362140, partial [marine metagenome]
VKKEIQINATVSLIFRFQTWNRMDFLQDHGQGILEDGVVVGMGQFVIVDTLG